MAVSNVDNRTIEYVIVRNAIFSSRGGVGWYDSRDRCGVQQSSIETIFSPTFVKISCNSTPQEALIETGSSINIIHEQLLNKILHK